jgi:hypothetical protein
MTRLRGTAAGVAFAIAAAGCAGSGASISGTAGSGSPGSGGAGGSGAGTGNGGSGNGAGGGSTGGSSPNFVLACSGAALGSPMLRLMTRTELANTLNAVFPEAQGMWTSSLPANTISAHGFDNDGSSTVGTQLAGAVLDMALSLATAEIGTPLGGVLSCSSSASTANHACAQTFLTKYGTRLFHRPLTSAEQTSYLAFFDASLGKSDFKTALKWMIVALIQSPNALYRSEIGTDGGNGMRSLTPYEVATELAYTYTGAPPSDALITMAGNNAVGDPAAQARTMLATDGGKQALQHFFEQYVDYVSVTSMQKPNIATFANVAADMVSETRAFIDQVIIQNGGGLKELLTANTTNPSKALAAYYATGNAFSGTFPVPATDYAQVTRPAGLGLGVLAQGAFLATHASSTTSSPTKRGLFPYYRLFCNDKLTPPANVPPLDTTSVVPNVNTTRDRYESLHATAQPCAGCHARFDPIGFGFEHYDEGGRFRAMEGTFAINSADSITAPDGSTLSFTGEDDLMTGIANQPVIHQCVSAYLAAYAYGSDQACLGASQVTDLQSGAIGLKEAFARLASEPHFTTRTSN